MKTFDFNKFKGLIKSNKLVIKSIEKNDTIDSRDGSKVPGIILNLAKDVTATGSQPLPDLGPNGQPVMKTMQGRTVRIAGEDDLNTFFSGLKFDDKDEIVKEADGTILYEGEMGLDVSNPKFANRNGTRAIVRGSELWLTSTKFSKRANDLRNKANTSSRDLMTKFFSAGVVVEGANTVEQGTGGGIQQAANQKAGDTADNGAAIVAGQEQDEN